MSLNAKEALLSGFEIEHPPPKWMNLPDSLNRKRYSHGAVVLDDETQKIMVVGGWEDMSSPLRSVEVYDRVSNKWNKKWPKLNQCRAEHGTVLCGDKVYVLGGRTSEELLDSIECLDLSAKPHRWVTLDVKLSCPKSGCATVAINSYVYIMGGASEEGCLDRVDVLDTNAKKLYKGPPLNTARFGCASVLVGNKIHLVGGQDANGAPLDTIETLLVGIPKKTWQICSATLSTPRVYPGICVVRHCLVVVGGYDSNKLASRSVQVLDTKRELVWTYPAMTQPRFGCAVVALSNSRVVVLAGSSDSALASTEGVQLQACPLSTQIAAMELELQQVSGRGSSLNPFKTGGKSKSGPLNAFLKELRQNSKEEDIVRQSSFSAFDNDQLPAYDNGRIVAKKELKESGQARVYKGFMKEKDGTKKDVAIKVFKTKADWDDCKQELITLLKISGHPNVMEVLDFYEVPSPAFIMRYVAGGDLNDYLRKKGKFSGKPAVRLLKGIGQGIQHLHSHGIVHRDLKSPNILLEGRGSAMRPVVIDLGLGRRVNDGDGQFQTRGMMGTAAWMAPEMISKAYWSTKTDMYALGIIMWEVLTAGVPYPGKNFTQIVTQVHATNARPSVTLLTKNKVPQVQINLVQSLWHIDPAKRPSADVFLRQLE